METERPDPDALLEQIRQEEAESRRGKLKIYFGASAGVGKTYAMLSAARAASMQGIDVLIGVVETHGRAETEALVAGIERLPLKEVSYRDRSLKEFDLDAALARKPALILVDELAHSNAAGSRHPKRWQDVEELLAAGIDVWSTMNVQHLDSLNDVVGSITGIRVWETVPDRVFDEADEVVMVDLPPDDLLQRMKEGKVYLPQQAERAVRNFFRKGNLIALRELALRRTADRVDEDMLAWRQRGAVQTVWGTRESLLACVGPGEHGEKTVRSTARLAAQLDVPWHAIYAETPALQRLSEPRRQRVLRTLKMAQDMGAVTATPAGQDVAATIVRYAREHNLSRIVLGRSARQRRWPWQRTLADRVGALGADLDVLQIALPGTTTVRAAPEPAGEVSRIDWSAYVGSAAVCVAVTLVASPLHDVFELSNIVMLFLLAVVGVALRWGSRPAVLAAFLSVASFDLFYVPPRFTFAVSDVQYLVTFVVMLVVALVIGQMTASLSYQARVAQRREERMRALYEMSRDLSGALLTEQVAEIGERFLKAEFQAKSALLVADAKDKLMDPVSAGEGPTIDRGIAQWSFDKAEAAGHGTDTLPASPTLYVPLTAPMRVRGVLAVEPRDPSRLIVPEQRRMLDTCASLLAISLERIHYIDVAQDTTVQMESERLRNSLLAAISHDLRTPLAALYGLADSLALSQPSLPPAQHEMAEALRQEARRMNAMVNNLLDMARLQSGAVQLNLQWQPLEEVVGSALQSLGNALARHQVRTELPPDLPLVRFDATLIERVLVNLLENAAKYTPPGSAITVSARVQEKELEVSVADNGPGLPPGREAALFDKFTRGVRESATSGVGLGLAICRAIVQAHEGRIWAEPASRGGACFRFTLPLGTPPALPAAESEFEENEASTTAADAAASPAR